MRENPNLKLVVLAKHGLIVWGDSAEEAYRKTIEVINQAVAFVNERTGDTVALRRAQDRARRLAAGAAAGDPRRGQLRAREGPDGRHVRPRDGVRLLRAGGAAGDGRRAVPGSPRAHQAPAAVDLARGRDARAHRRAGRRLPRRLPRVLRAVRGRGRRGRRPRRADRARRGHGHGLRGHDDQALEGLARPLSPRDRGDGGRRGARPVRLPGRRRELRDRVLAARALQARAGAGARRAAGQGRAGHRRRRRDRPRDHRDAGRAPARAWSPSISTATAPRKPWPPTATVASRWPAT